MKDNPRDAALNGLLLVERGAFISEALNSLLQEYQLNDKNVRLTTELLYGTVRMQATLDYLLNQISNRKMDSLSPIIRNILRLGSYQLVFLDRIPASAAVNESVKLTPKRNRKPIAGFINGVLRNLARKQDSLTLPDLTTDPTNHIATKYSYPQWMVTRWIERWGVQETVEFCRINNNPRETSLRVNTLKTSVEAVKQALEAKGIHVSLGQFAPDVLLVGPGLQILEDPLFAAGHYYIQNESSALVSHALAPKPGELIYDICSAPGGKSTHIGQLMGNLGDILSIDQTDSKLTLVRENAKRLGVRIIRTLAADATQLPALPLADRVLVDAPCSGLGVLRHKPDIRWRKSENEIKKLPIIQRDILAQAAKLVKPSGILGYSTCTTEIEENQDIINWFLECHPNFRFFPLPGWFPNTPGGMVEILPQHYNLDGFFICVLENYEN